VHITDPVRARLTRAVAEGVTPGAVLALVDRSGATAVAATGTRRSGGPATDADTRYDLASLTKVVATLPSVLKLVAAGEIGLDDHVDRFFSGAGLFQAPSVADVPVRALLAHASGLPAWKPLYAQPTDRRAALAYVLNAPLEHPAGTVVYSDLGFMLLGAIVERVAHERLDAFAAREVFAPLGMHATGFGPLSGVPVAATEDCGWRDRMLEGEVHDENATAWDGIAGHAGLFGTAGDLARYAHAWLTRDERLAPAALLDGCVREAAVGADGARRGLGWILAFERSIGGPGARGYGHSGFTGTSLWIEPDGGHATVLLTNRVHPRRGSPAGIHALRQDVHALVRATSAPAPVGGDA
jgi:CubicO group peptidase (beta-lactamase class C family)